LVRNQRKNNLLASLSNFPASSAISSISYALEVLELSLDAIIYHPLFIIYKHLCNLIYKSYRINLFKVKILQKLE